MYSSLILDADGNDQDGRRYTIKVRATNQTGNLGLASATVTVPRK